MRCGLVWQMSCMKGRQRGGRLQAQVRHYDLQADRMKGRRGGEEKMELRGRTDLDSVIVATPMGANPYLGLAQTLRRGGGLQGSGLLMDGAEGCRHAQNVRTGEVGCQMALCMAVTCPPRLETGPVAWWKMKPLHDAGLRLLPPQRASPLPMYLGFQPPGSCSSSYLVHQEHAREVRAC